MIKLITIVGARPQFIKAAALNRIIRTQFKNQIEEIIVHTGQHFDDEMSSVFFDELEITPPKYNLEINGGGHAFQTGQMGQKMEEILLKEKPHAIVLYGDTNSTLAGALTASKIHIPVIHIEAGLRSFNKKMPEEINRILSDQVSTLLFCPTQTAVDNLNHEGFDIEKPTKKVDMNHPGVFMVGDIMYDCALYFKEKANKEVDLQKSFSLSKPYLLATVHRPSNTDNLENLSSIFKAFIEISKNYEVDIALPLHPRTKKAILKLPEDLQNEISNFIKLLPPASYLEMIALQSNCKMILTDSGGIQKEAYFHKKPCIVLREETEWIELLETGMFELCGSDNQKIKLAYERLSDKKYAEETETLYGNGDTAIQICRKLVEYFD